MKFRSKLIALSLPLFISMGAFAAGELHKGSFQVGTTVMIGDKSLPAGAYQMQWEGSGPNVEVSIVQSGKVLTKIPAHVVDLSEKSPDNMAELRTNTDGNRSLSEIRFSGKKYAITIDRETAQAQAVKADNSGR